MSIEQNNWNNHEHNGYEKEFLELLFDKKKSLFALISSFFEFFMKEHDRE
jgi:hypothetical protein